MRNYNEQINLDWSRHKTVDIKKRGNLSILMPQMPSNANAGKEKAQCIWPSALSRADSRFLTRRVWSR